MGHKDSVTTTQLCLWSIKVATDSKLLSDWGCVLKKEKKFNWHWNLRYEISLLLNLYLMGYKQTGLNLLTKALYQLPYFSYSKSIF